LCVYIHSGSLVYCHKEDDKASYRHTLASLVVNNLCTIGELSSAMGINLNQEMDDAGEELGANFKPIFSYLCG